MKHTSNTALDHVQAHAHAHTAAAHTANTHSLADHPAATPDTVNATRRGLLQASGTIGAGFMLGVALPAGHKAAQAAGTLHTPNAWVHIADDNTITLLSARSEMGQGVYTSMPMLIAEELGVDITQIQVAIAPPNAVYINSLLGGQLTGGSTSVREGWEKLRTAGAQVREMLLAAAAAQWKVDASKLWVSKGYVYNRTSAGIVSASYGSLAEAASKLPVPAKVVLKDPKDFAIIGKRTPRLDTPSKVNGTAEFGIDVKLPGMVYASLAQCPVIGGKVKSFDGARAKAMPGVVDVVKVDDGVAVVAASYWQAKKARDTLKIEWDLGAGEAIDTDSMLVGIRDAANSETPLMIGKPVGKVDEALAAADTPRSSR
jgi:isoquinoline 1-oxidoreductase subunit beta